MIGILLKDNEFEQDIRELLMAFYPGERFAHQETEGMGWAAVTGGPASSNGFRSARQGQRLRGARGRLLRVRVWVRRALRLPS